MPDSKSRLNKLSKFNQIYYVLLKKNAVRFDLIEDFKFERQIKVIYKVKISVCFYEKALNMALFQGMIALFKVIFQKKFRTISREHYSR